MTINSNAAPTGIGSGAVVKAVAAKNYLTGTSTATEISADYPALAIADRFRLTLQTARLVCELAKIGGRLA